MRTNLFNHRSLAGAALTPIVMLMLALAGPVPIAHAHPIGNFTINQYAQLTVAPGALRLLYVLDMAELPTITERQDMDRDEDGEISDAETRAYLADRVPRWLSRMAASVDGKTVAWSAKESRVVFTPGVANLSTMRVEVEAAAPVAPGRHAIALENGNYSERAGWKEVVVAAAKGVAAPEGAGAFADKSRVLRRYPEDLVDNPPQVTSASFRATFPALSAAQSPKPAPAGPAPKPTPKLTVKPVVRPVPKPVTRPAASRPSPAKPLPAPSAVTAPAAAARVVPAPREAAPVKEKAAPIQGPAAKAPTTEPDAPKMAAPAPMAPRPVPALAPATTPPLPRSPAPPVAGSTSPAARRFHSLVTAKALTPGLLLASLAIAFVLGALHALQPGHGKTLVAAYLVGQRGTARHAVLLGLTVTVSHTFGVFLLGAVALFASQYVLPEELVPWMGFASGVLIAALGAGMLLARLRGAPSGQDHPHGHDHGHDHLHDHGHVHDHDHDQPHTHHEHDHSHAHAAAGVALHHGHDHTHSHTHSHAHPHGDALEHSHSPFGRHTHSHAVPDTLSLRSLIALGISGGIVPCWDALIVLLGAVAIHRTLLGMTLIVAFSAGLATTLTAAGLAVVWGQRWTRFGQMAPERVRLLSMASSAVIVVLGVAMAWQALASGGLLPGSR